MNIIKIMPIIGTTRFNSTTWEQNRDWRAVNKPSGCAYGVMKTIGERIPLNSSVYVLEMNNTTNTIMGIGLVVNCPDPLENVKIYKDYNYCCYLYTSDFRIDLTEFSRKEKSIIKIFEHLVFKDKSHLKRGQGITALPDKMIRYVISKGINLMQELQFMFVSRNQTALLR
jgi:hypothetical protein